MRALGNAFLTTGLAEELSDLAAGPVGVVLALPVAVAVL